MRKKKLVSVGNSVALVIDQAVLRMMGLRHGSVVTLETDGRTLIVRGTGEKACDRGSNRAAGASHAGAPIDCEAARKAGLSTTEFANLTTRAPAVFQRLMEMSLSTAAFRALYHRTVPDESGCGETRDWMRTLCVYGSWVDSDARFNPTDAELATMLRFEACYGAYDGIHGWTTLAKQALDEVPMVREPDYAGPTVEVSGAVEAPVPAEKPRSFMDGIWAMLEADEDDKLAAKQDRFDDEDDDDRVDYSVSS
jgi:antitoxin component of MazEF toxin-antitoxin module